MLGIFMAFLSPTSAHAASAYSLNADGYCGSTSCIQSSVDRSNLSYIDYRKMGVNLQVFAGHNYKSSGVTIAKLRTGDTVKVSGNGSGTYKVTRIVEVAKGSSTAAVPKGVAFQTCVGNKLRLVYVSKVVQSHNPIGHMDSVTVNNDGTITFRGWGLDQDATGSSTQVHVYIDGKGYAVNANQSRSDVKKAYSMSTDKLGFSWTSPKLSNGNHKISVAVINVGGGSNVWFWSGTKSTSGHMPTGNVESMSAYASKITISGWALDRDSSEGTQVHVYIDGEGYNIGKTTISRTDVKNSQLGKTDKLGFSWTSPTLSAGAHKVDVYAINVGEGSNKLIRSSTITTTSTNPTGHLDSIKVSGDKVSINGWAFDKDANKDSVQVHVYIDGQGYNIGTTSNARADVKRVYGLGTDKVGFSWTSPSLSTGKHKVDVYAINVGGGNNVLVSSTTVTVSAPKASARSLTVAPTSAPTSTSVPETVESASTPETTSEQSGAGSASDADAQSGAASK